MIIPGSGITEGFIRARQAQLRPGPRARTPAHVGLRVRIGRVLIAAGHTIGGERVDIPARPSSSPKPA
jgi:hypothetical protein